MKSKAKRVRMKGPMATLRAPLRFAKKANPVVLTVAPPVKDSQSGDYYCRIKSTAGDGFRIDVFGVTPSQAINLALEMSAMRVAKIVYRTMAEMWDELSLEEKPSTD